MNEFFENLPPILENPRRYYSPWNGCYITFETFDNLNPMKDIEIWWDEKPKPRTLNTAEGPESEDEL